MAEPPSTPVKQKDLSRDERLKAQTLKGIGWRYEQIAAHIGCTTRQAQYACTNQLTPQKRCAGRKALINSPSRKALGIVIRSKLKNNS